MMLQPALEQIRCLPFMTLQIKFTDFYHWALLSFGASSCNKAMRCLVEGIINSWKWPSNSEAKPHVASCPSKRILNVPRESWGKLYESCCLAHVEWNWGTTRNTSLIAENESSKSGSFGIGHTWLRITGKLLSNVALIEWSMSFSISYPRQTFLRNLREFRRPAR